MCEQLARSLKMKQDSWESRPVYQVWRGACFNCVTAGKIVQVVLEFVQYRHFVLILYQRGNRRQMRFEQENVQKCVFGGGSAPDPTGGVYSTFQYSWEWKRTTEERSMACPSSENPKPTKICSGLASHFSVTIECI